MISPLMVSSKIVKVSQKRCLGSSIESFTSSSPSEQIIDIISVFDWHMNIDYSLRFPYQMLTNFYLMIFIREKIY